MHPCVSEPTKRAARRSAPTTNLRAVSGGAASTISARFSACRTAAAEACHALSTAHNLDEDLHSDDTIRLALQAASVLRDVETLTVAEGVEPTAVAGAMFDALALIRAARNTPTDVISPERAALLDSAFTMVNASIAFLPGFEGHALESIGASLAPAAQTTISGETPLTEAGQHATDLLLQCTYEIEPLSKLLVEKSWLLDGNNLDTAMIVRAAAVRIKQLNSVLMTYLGEDEFVTLGEVHFKVYQGTERLPDELNS